MPCKIIMLIITMFIKLMKRVKIQKMMKVELKNKIQKRSQS